MSVNLISIKRKIKRIADYMHGSISRQRTKATINKMKKEMIDRNTLLTEIEGESAMILAPHVDDDFIGCGGVICQFMETGKSVDIVYLTDSGKRGSEKDWQARALERREEAYHIAEQVGLPKENLHFLKAEDGDLMNFNIEEDLSNIIAKVQPELIFLPIFIDTHKDHVASVGQLIGVIEKYPNLLRTSKIYFYESQSPITQKYSNVTLDISSQWERKKEILKGYQSQNSDFEFVEALNKVNGIIYERPYCEIFLQVLPEDLLQLKGYYPQKFLALRENLSPVRNSASLFNGYSSSMRMKEILLELGTGGSNDKIE